MDEEQEFTFDGATDDTPRGKAKDEPKFEIVTADDDGEVDVIDDTPERDKGRKPLDKEVADPTEEELRQYSQGVKQRVAELTHARHDERRRREAAEREAAEAARVAQQMLEQNRQLQAQYNQGAQEYIGVSKKAAEAEVEAARRKLREAKDAYDTEAELAAQEELMEAKLKLKQVSEMRAPVAQTEEPVVQNAKSQPQVDPKTLIWQARNQWFGKDEEMTSMALAVHNRLLKAGHDPRSDEYFEAIDARMREKFPEAFESAEQKRRPEPTRKASVVAPATRSSNGPRKVQLTRTQLALAEKLNISPQQYAAELVKMEKQNG